MDAGAECLGRGRREEGEGVSEEESVGREVEVRGVKSFVDVLLTVASRSLE